MLRRFAHHGVRTCAVLLAAFASLVASSPVTSAGGAPNVTANVSISVEGNSVSGATTISSSASTQVSRAGICVRSAAGTNYDFPMTQGATLSTAGTKVTATVTLPPGRYAYWSCVKPAGSWWQFIAPGRWFTVTGSSGSSLPVGDLPGWTQVFRDDFLTPTPEGTFPGPYAPKWSTYNGFTDTYDHGVYDRDIMSVHDGLLDTYFRKKDGTARVSAATPLINGSWVGQTYGRYSARFRADPAVGYRMAWLLWPDSENWNQGEIDFPETWFTGKIDGFNHCINNPRANCYSAWSGISPNDWHTVTINWTPALLSFVIDGQVIGSTTKNIPHSNMHWILQNETVGHSIATGSGHLYVDWVTIYKYTP